MPYQLKRFDQFRSFCKAQKKYPDSEIHIVLMKGLADDLNLSREERLWLGFLYMAYYNAGSTYAAFRTPGVRGRKRMPPLNYPIGKDRRNLYGGRIEKHLKELMEKPSLTEWLDVRSWDKLLKRLAGIWGNGRWACTTTAELLVKIGGVAVKPTSYVIEGSTGPARGLRSLGLPVEEKSADYLRRKLEDSGVDVSIELLESVLCNFGSLCRGRFYVGHHIDVQQGTLSRVEKLAGEFHRPWDIRRNLIDNRCLGELHGWNGVDPDRKKVFRDSHKMLFPWEERR